ncbi:MAG: alpha-D-ribose 1-methylphosphonate 5-phosphate C-P-lyase PhnJ [Acetobacteraceae bacterium]|nr:alpha-D-ribose 1-methylphosphonate 5-phosphate C-P-lyase PhnJ [Acetobacteraceae bacterium]
MIRRALLKALAIPGHQVPFASREMPLALRLGHRRHAGDRVRDRA